MADDPYAYLSSLSAHPKRAGDTSNFNPAFATALASAIRQARAEGLNVGLESGFRAPGQTGSAYDAGGNSSHSYGLAGDVSGLDGANGKVTQRWAQIAEANGLHNPYGVGDAAEFNHWQLPEQPLEQNPKLLASLKQASATGDIHNVWSAFNSGGGPSRPGTPTPGPLMFSGLNPGARGMRNNNPGNLVANSFTAGMPGYKGSDGKFAIFDTPEHGAAALDQNLTSYASKGINTPLGVASTWAPAGDNNNPNSYGAQIAKSLGLGPNDKIDLTDPSVRNKVAQAIGRVENGPGSSTGFRTAYTGYGTTLNSPTLAASGPPASAATGQPGQPSTGLAGNLPGFQSNSPGAKMTAAGLQQLAGGGGGQPPAMPSMQLPPPMAMGGPMMLGPGGQNMYGRAVAQQNLAQRGFPTAPSLPAYAGGGAQSPVPVMPPGQATGMPSMPGTTLNSPSQLHMALMTGALSPYDLYGAGGTGSA